MIITDFVMKLQDDLEKRDLSETSVLNYIKTIINLHKKIEGNEKVKNLNFLTDIDAIENSLTDYKDNTKKTIYNTLCSILHPLKTKRKFKNAYDYYKQKSEDINKEIKINNSKNNKTETQQENWITWTEVLEIKKDLEEETEKVINKKNITENEFNTLLKNVALSFYTEIPPRRNEYINLIITNNQDDLNKNKNYLIYDDNILILNKYKTANKYGSKEIEIPATLKKDIDNYLKYHSSFNSIKKKKKYETPFFVNNNGAPFIQNNSLTRLLNKIFKKNIGASMLRHIYLTHKYGDDLEEMKEDADDMGHSLNIQKEYIKKKE